MHRFAFVLEQTLGHVAHSKNVVRSLAREPEIDATVIPVDFNDPSWLCRLPGLRTWSWRASAATRRALRERLRRGPLDAAFIHTQVAALLAVEIMRSVPTIVSLDATPRLFDLEADAYGHRLNAALVESLKHRANLRAFEAAAGLVTWCRLAADSLVSDYGIPAEKIEVIPPGVDLDRFRPAERANVRARVQILFVGGQFERKGGPDLLEAVRRLDVPVELDIVTAGAVTGIPAGVVARVHRGLKPQSDALVDLYRSADIFVLPSRGDCMPQAVAEALASGLPVVATRVGAISEMVRDGENGRLVAAGDPRALGAALADLAGNRAARVRMGLAGRISAELEQDADRNNRRIFDLMTRVGANRVVEERSA